jgi:hypothetical protein
VQQPPAIDLRGYPTVGLLQLSSTAARGSLPAYATQQFLQQVQVAQPGVRVLELGPEQAALAAVGRQQLDADAIRGICQRNNVQALFAGTLDAPEVKPSVSLEPFAATVGVHIKAQLQIAVRLYDAGGATIWTDAASRQQETGGVGIGPGNFDVAAEDPNNAYAQMARHEAHTLTDVFRSHWVSAP